MSYVTVRFAPGVIGTRDSTALAAEGHWVDADKVRFYNGAPQNVQGYESLGASVVVGIPRKLHGWAILTGQLEIAIGTHSRVYIIEANQPNNVTPIRDSGTLGTDPFTTASGQTTVTVHDTAHGASMNDTVIFSGATTVHGLDMNATWTIATVIDDDHYTIEHTNAASGAGTGGGASVAYQYEITIGRSSQLYGFGFGAGPFGGSTWGTARSTSETLLQLRTWSIDNWGEDLLISHNDQGALYLWDASSGLGTRAAVVSQAPLSEFSIIDPESRHVILLGADGDPLNIAWCDQDDYTNWTPAADSTADSRRLLHGSRFKGYLRTKDQILIWTDAALYSMQYIGATDYAYSITRIGSSGHLIGVNAVCELGGRVYWMGTSGFLMYDGVLHEIPCPIYNTVFQDLDRTQGTKVVAALLEDWNEVWWFYPSASGNGEIDRYAILSTLDGTWTPGVADNGFQVLAWQDRGLFTDPISVDENGQTYYHDLASTKNGDGAAIPAFVESAEFDLGDGDMIMFSKGYIPDAIIAGTLLVTQRARLYPNSAAVVKGPDSITSSTKIKKTKIRGRQMSVLFASDQVDDAWRIGAFRWDVQPDGRKG